MGPVLAFMSPNIVTLDCVLYSCIVANDFGLKKGESLGGST